jgi:hypothetical protein
LPEIRKPSLKGMAAGFFISFQGKAKQIFLTVF